MMQPPQVSLWGEEWRGRRVSLETPRSSLARTHSARPRSGARRCCPTTMARQTCLGPLMPAPSPNLPVGGIYPICNPLPSYWLHFCQKVPLLM